MRSDNGPSVVRFTAAVTRITLLQRLQGSNRDKGASIRVEALKRGIKPQELVEIYARVSIPSPIGRQLEISSKICSRLQSCRGLCYCILQQKFMATRFQPGVTS